MADLLFWPYIDPAKPKRRRKKARFGFVLSAVLGFGTLAAAHPAVAQQANNVPPRSIGTRVIGGLTYQVLEDENKVIYIEPDQQTSDTMKVETKSGRHIVFAKYSSTQSEVREKVQVLETGPARSLIEYDYSARLTDHGTLIDKNLNAYYATADAGKIVNEGTDRSVRATGRQVMGEVAAIGNGILDPHPPRKLPPALRLLKDIALVPVRVVEIPIPYHIVHYARKGSVLNTLHAPDINSGDNVLVRHYNDQRNLDQVIELAMNRSPIPAPVRPLPQSPALETASVSLPLTIEASPEETAQFIVPPQSSPAPAVIAPSLLRVAAQKPRMHVFPAPKAPPSIPPAIVAQVSPPAPPTLPVPMPAASASLHAGSSAKPGGESPPWRVDLAAGLLAFGSMALLRAYSLSRSTLKLAPAFAAEGNPPATPHYLPASFDVSRARFAGQQGRVKSFLAHSAESLRNKKWMPSATAFAVGFGTNTVVRLAAAKLFVVAAASITVPAAFAPAATIAATVGIGVVAGGLGGLAAEAWRTRHQERKEHWARNAFLKSAAFGAVGVGVAQCLHADQWLGHLFHSHAAAVTASHTASHTAAQAPVHAAPSVDVAAHAVAATPNDMLTPDLLKHMPAHLQHLAGQHNAAAYDKISSFLAQQPGAKAHELAVKMMHEGLKLDPANAHLHANLAYMECNGIGTVKDLHAAGIDANLGGHAAGDYRGKFFAFLHNARHAVPSPTPG